MNTPAKQTRKWRNVRCFLIVVAVLITLIGLFYTEENWRGQRAWESCKKNLEAKGVDLKWADYISAPVPEEQNVFGVPEMQKWFVGRGATELSKKIEYPAMAASTLTEKPSDRHNARLVVADVKIQLPGVNSRNTPTALKLGDPQAQEKATRMLKEALGPVALHPASSSVSTNLLFTPRSLEDIRPAQIVLECQTEPTTNDLLKFLPSVDAFTDTTDDERLQLVPENGGYKATMSAPDTTAAFLKWNAQFAPEFALVRDALQRPFVRMQANYNTPNTVAIPNFTTSRAFVQAIGAMTECHLLQGNSDAALDDLTRIHEICHIFTNRPITLVGAMINIAVRGLYVDTIADGLRLQAWREPQLAALEEQLKTIDLITPLHETFRMEPVGECEVMRSLPPVEMFKLFFGDSGYGSWREFKLKLQSSLFPRGWFYQNMVIAAQTGIQTETWFDPANQTVFPKRADADQAALSALSTSSPFSCIAVGLIPNNLKACQTASLNQTKVRQAFIACALERYHLAHGEYPESLNALVPQYISEIPNDVIGRQPFHYHRAADGTFILYSIGWSGRDGGGMAGKSKGEGDWVWPETTLR